MNIIEFKLQREMEIVRDILAGFKTFAQIGKDHGVTHVTVAEIANRHGIQRKRGKASPAWKNKLLRIV